MWLILTPTPDGQKLPGRSSGISNHGRKRRGEGSCTFWRGRGDKWERCPSKHWWRPGNWRLGKNLHPRKLCDEQGSVRIKAEAGAGLQRKRKEKRNNATDHRWYGYPFYDFFYFLCEDGFLLIILNLDNIKTEFFHTHNTWCHSTPFRG